MDEGMRSALERLNNALGGDVAGFVCARLKISREQLAQYFKAEQVDSIALAIYNIEARHEAMVCGDETGVGKGRQAAGIVRYAKENGRLPIFFTEKKNLFSDFYRDAKDTGIAHYKPLIINSDGTVYDYDKCIDPTPGAEKYEAVYEPLPNALCHRQYERTSASVSLAIYDDRVEIVNPGKFPPQLTTDTIRMSHESYPYNKKIAQVLYLTKNLEKWGTGANRMIELCREQGVAEPEWTIGNGTVTITFKRPSVGISSEQTTQNLHRNYTETLQKLYRNFTETLQKKDRDIAELVINNPEVTQTEMAATLDLSRQTIANRLKSMQERGILKRVGPDNGGRWELIIPQQ